MPLPSVLAFGILLWLIKEQLYLPHQAVLALTLPTSTVFEANAALRKLRYWTCYRCLVAIYFNLQGGEKMRALQSDEGDKYA